VERPRPVTLGGLIGGLSWTSDLPMQDSYDHAELQESDLGVHQLAWSL
jgi:hypothetical protein